MHTTLSTRDEQADVAAPVAAVQQPIRTPRPRRFAPAVRRPWGRDDRFRGPRLRPAISPSFGVGATRFPDEVIVEPATSAQPGATPASRWRLTERGIAVVLVAGLMITVAALTVVTATAFRVTGETYQVTSQLQG